MTQTLNLGSLHVTGWSGWIQAMIWVQIESFQGTQGLNIDWVAWFWFEQCKARVGEIQLVQNQL